MEQKTEASQAVEPLQQQLIRYGALRQLRHNDGRPGFVFAYDVDITNRFLAALKAQPAPTEAAQGEDSARLDALADEIETMESEHGRECFGKQSDFAHYAEGHENARKAAAARIREFNGAIDRARASAETGGMKS